MNLVSIVHISSKKLIETWVHSNRNSPPGCTGYFNAYHSLKVLMDLQPAFPDCQLQFGKSCTLPYVKASKCGLEKDFFATDLLY